MKDTLTLYKFGALSVRTMKDGEEFWFVAKDIATALDYSSESNATRLFANVPDEWKGVKPIHTLGGEQDVLCVSEQGLYFFLGRSDKPKALPFQKWVAGEVIPSIRKTGAYAVPSKRENPLLSNLEAASFLYEKAGLVGNHLALALDRVAQKKTGESLLALGDVVLETKDNEVVYTPTEIGKMMVPPVSGREVNLRLIEAGLQVATGSKHGPYQPTQRGKEEGATLVDVAITGKAEPITHLKWPKAVIKLIDFEPVLDV